MRAIEFKSKVKDNKIQVPEKIQSQLDSDQDREIRVIVLIEDTTKIDAETFRKAAQGHFLNGYAESDAIYDNY